MRGTALTQSKSISIVDFIDYVDGLSAEEFARQGLHDSLAHFDVEMGALLQKVSFEDRCYARNLISKNDNYELIALAWKPGQETPIHCHGGQRCWMYLVQGSISTQNYGPIEDNRELPPKVGGINEYRDQGFLYIDDDLGVHSISNYGQVNAVSLHLYAKPIDRCRIWKSDSSSFEWCEPKVHFDLRS